MRGQKHFDRTRIAPLLLPEDLHELDHSVRIPSRAPQDLHADAIRFALVVAAELHQVTAGEHLGPGLSRMRAAGVAEQRAEEPEEAVRDRSLGIDPYRAARQCERVDVAVVGDGETVGIARSAGVGGQLPAESRHVCADRPIHLRRLRLHLPLRLAAKLDLVGHGHEVDCRGYGRTRR